MFPPPRVVASSRPFLASLRFRTSIHPPFSPVKSACPSCHRRKAYFSSVGIVRPRTFPASVVLGEEDALTCKFRTHCTRFVVRTCPFWIPAEAEKAVLMAAAVAIVCGVRVDLCGIVWCVRVEGDLREKTRTPSDPCGTTRRWARRRPPSSHGRNRTRRNSKDRVNRTQRNKKRRGSFPPQSQIRISSFHPIVVR